MRESVKHRLKSEGVVWTGGLLLLVGAVLWGVESNRFSAELLMVVATYVLGLHWIVAYLFNGVMYGAIRLRPAHKAMRAVIFALGILLVVLALWSALGFGGPFAMALEHSNGVTWIPSCPALAAAAHTFAYSPIIAALRD